jgi:hypothetical protein
MDYRAVSKGLAASLVFYLITRPLLKWHSSLVDNISNEIFALIVNLAHQPISISSWFIGGALVGYLCNANPIKNGALAGALYGIAFSIVGIALISGQTHDLTTKYLQLIRAAFMTGAYSFLFALSASFGNLLRSQRNVL